MKKNILCMVLICVAMLGCTNAERSQIGAYGSDFKVTIYSGGEPVRTWTSSGKVATEGDSDGWYFTDKKSQKLVRVSGSVTVEQL